MREALAQQEQLAQQLPRLKQLLAKARAALAAKDEALARWRDALAAPPPPPVGGWSVAWAVDMARAADHSEPSDAATPAHDAEDVFVFVTVVDAVSASAQATGTQSGEPAASAEDCGGYRHPRAQWLPLRAVQAWRERQTGAGARERRSRARCLWFARDARACASHSGDSHARSAPARGRGPGG